MVNTAKLKMSLKRKKVAVASKTKVVIRKGSAKPWHQIRSSPWFETVKEFLMSDSFMYGPLTVQGRVSCTSSDDENISNLTKEQ